MKYFIDTNIFLRVLIEEDKKTYIECKNFLEKVKSGKIKAVTSSLVLAEIGWTLISFYKFTREETARAIKSILNLNGLVVDDEIDWVVAMEIYTKHKIKLIDSLLASRKDIRNKKMVMVSYDKEFEKLEILIEKP